MTGAEVVVTLIRRVNQVCDAFGKDALVEEREGCCRVTQHHAEVLRAALEQES